MRKRLKKFLINASLFLGSLLISLLLCELLVRWLLPQQLLILDSDIWKPDSSYGWTHPPLVDKTINSGDGAIRFRTDSRGMRIAQPDTTKRKFLVIGDSFLEALAVESDSTIPERLKQWLNQSKNISIGYDNAAVGGYGPGQYYLRVRNHLQERPYDFGLIFLYVGNDFTVSAHDTVVSPRQTGSKGPLRMPENLSFEEIKKCILYPINESLERKSHLYVLTKKSLRSFLLKIGLSGYTGTAMVKLQKDHAQDSSWEKTADMCKLIQQQFARRNAKVYFVLLPDAVQIEPKHLQLFTEAYKIDPATLDVDQPNRILPLLMKERGLELIDPLERLRRAQKTTPQFGDVDSHLNSNGHRTVAEAIAAYLEGRLSL